MDKRMVKKEPNKKKLDKIFDFFLKSAPPRENSRSASGPILKRSPTKLGQKI